MAKLITKIAQEIIDTLGIDHEAFSSPNGEDYGATWALLNLDLRIAVQNKVRDLKPTTLGLIIAQAPDGDVKQWMSDGFFGPGGIYARAGLQKMANAVILMEMFRILDQAFADAHDRAHLPQKRTRRY